MSVKFLTDTFFVKHISQYCEKHSNWLFVFLYLFERKAIPFSMLLKSYNYELAIQLIRKEKKSAEMDFLKAKCYKNIGQLKPAIELLEDLMKQDSYNLSEIIELADC